MPTPYPQKYLIQRKNTYYYRRRVPSALKHCFKNPIFMLSLKTSDISYAEYICNGYNRYFDQLLSNEILCTMSSRRPANVMDFTLKRTTAPDGTVKEEVEITPDDLKACLDAGMTPEQSANYFKELTKISKEITCTLQNTQNQNSKGLYKAGRYGHYDAL